MLVISRDQRQNTGEPAFVDRIVKHLRLHYLLEMYVLDDDELQVRVKHCVALARANGLTFEKSLATFTANMLRINPEFYKQPTLARILADTERPESERLEAMLSEATPADWDEAENHCDAYEYWKNVDMPQGDKE